MKDLTMLFDDRQTKDNCQRQLWEIQKELEGYAALLKGLGAVEIQGEAFYGIGLALERMSRKLDKVTSRLDKHLS